MLKRIAVIAAKGASTRLALKNFKVFHENESLSDILIKKTLSLPIEHVVFSSESENFIDLYSNRYGGSCKNQSILFHKRPYELSIDPSTLLDVVKDALYSYRNILFCNPYTHVDVVLLLPTSPLLEVVQILEAFDLLNEYPDSRILSIVENTKPPFNSWSYTDEKRVFLQHTFPNSEFKNVQSTRCPDTYQSNGLISAWRIDKSCILDKKSTVGLLIPSEQSIDIDTEFDFRIAQYLYAGSKKKCTRKDQ